MYPFGEFFSLLRSSSLLSSGCSHYSLLKLSSLLRSYFLSRSPLFERLSSLLRLSFSLCHLHFFQNRFYFPKLSGFCGDFLSSQLHSRRFSTIKGTNRVFKNINILPVSLKNRLNNSKSCEN